jgi:hypothetical protein
MTGLVRSSAKAFTRTAKAISTTGKRVLPKEGDPFGLNKKLVQNAEHGDKKAGQIRFSPKAPPAPEDPVIPLPDEDALELARRRRRSRRSGSRANTVLSAGDDATGGPAASVG